jgi:hypothetical protein
VNRPLTAAIPSERQNAAVRGLAVSCLMRRPELASNLAGDSARNEITDEFMRIEFSEATRGVRWLDARPRSPLCYYGAIWASLCIDVTLRALLLAPLPLN